MRRHLMFALLLLLPTLPALAEQADSTIFNSARITIKLVQLSSDERRELRERWEQASPEERIRMRQFFQDRLRQLPTPAQEAIRIPFPTADPRDIKRGRDGRRAQDIYPPADSRFGFGFERRHVEEEDSEAPGWSNKRHPRDEERR